jgi:glycosyltransferase involved in cell wall biosynthesis
MHHEPLNLLFVIVDLYGGAGVYCKTLAAGMKRFADRAVRTHLLLFRNPSMTDEEMLLFDTITKLDLPVHTDWRRSFETVRDIRRVGDALATQPADITLSIGTYANLLVPYAAPQRKIILTEHLNLSGRLAESKSRVVLPKLIRWRYPGRTVVVPSEGAADDLRDNYGLNDVRVIPHGVDADRITELADEPIDRPANAYFIAVGRLVPQKDYPTMLTAFTEAHGRGINHDLVILGSGSQESALKELAGKLGVGDRVHFQGQTTNTYPWIKHARALVLSSIYEGFGLVLLEAMNLGIPCISTDCPSGPAEILGSGKFGTLVPMRNPHALANAMLELASNPGLRQALIDKAFQRAGELSLGRMTARYLELFDDLHQA